MVCVGPQGWVSLALGAERKEGAEHAQWGSSARKFFNEIRISEK